MSSIPVLPKWVYRCNANSIQILQAFKKNGTHQDNFNLRERRKWPRVGRILLKEKSRKERLAVKSEFIM